MICDTFYFFDTKVKNFVTFTSFVTFLFDKDKYNKAQWNKLYFPLPL